MPELTDCLGHSDPRVRHFRALASDGDKPVRELVRQALEAIGTRDS